MSEPKVSYEEFIPTDRFTLQDMYFWGIQLLRQDYAKIMRGYYNNKSRDSRALIEFFADADGFYWFANVNITEKAFLNDKQKDFLRGVFEEDKASIDDPKVAREVFRTLMCFASRSKLTDLSESRPMGDFAYARQRLGIAPKREGAFGQVHD